MKYLNTKKGFTLIELLVVISIVSLLSTVVLSSVQSARKKAITASTINQVRQYVSALELYYDANGYYPNPSGATGQNVISFLYCLGSNSSCGWSSSPSSANTTLTTALNPHIKSYAFTNSVQFAGSNVSGVEYGCFYASSDGKCNTIWLQYSVSGDARSKCNFAILPEMTAQGYPSYSATYDVTHCKNIIGPNWNDWY